MPVSNLGCQLSTLARVEIVTFNVKVYWPVHSMHDDSTISVLRHEFLLAVYYIIWRVGLVTKVSISYDSQF